MTAPDRRERGLTLVELLVVVGLLALAAAIAMPGLRPRNHMRVELAASQVADAMRHARSEALRTGERHGFFVEPAQNRIRVYRADTAAAPATPVYDVYHPVTRHLYDLDLDGPGMLQGVDLATAGWTWTDTCDAAGRVSFDADGRPHCGDPFGVLLDSARVVLSLGGASLDVVVQGEVGRVVVQ